MISGCMAFLRRHRVFLVLRGLGVVVTEEWSPGTIAEPEHREHA